MDEPSLDESVLILEGLRPRYEAHHKVRYTPAALEAAVRLAQRHLRELRLPDSEDHNRRVLAVLALLGH